MAKQIFTYTVPKVYQDGVVCDNPSIDFDIPDCINTPCIIEGDTITIELDPDDTSCNCIHVIIDCPDDCELCDATIIKKCFCNSNDDCPECHECVDGICQPICPDKICVNDYCVDCATDDDCDYNQICLNGDCTCPSGFVKDSLGRCVDCLTNADCDECEVCQGGECKPKCPSDFCIDGECKGCLIDSDCTGDNECCVDGKCECCEGYVWDPSLQTCVVQPDCRTSGDCPDCYNCVETANGKKCEPTQCPPGYIAYFEGDKCCYRECDCTNPSCPSGEYCREVLNGKCICTPNKCQGPCAGPEDCGDGCGCLDGQCVDCSTLNCETANDCERALGCGCNDNGSCEYSTDCDNQPCVTPADCPYNCGCDNNDCVDCTNVPCSEPDHCPFGCYCETGVGMCRPNPCVEVYCETGDECGPGCGCDPTSNRCIPCNSVDCDYCQDISGCHCPNNSCVENPDDSCQDSLTIEKEETTCDVVITASTNDCCECDEWKLNNTITATTQGSGTAMDTFTLNTALQGVNTDPANWNISVLINYSIVHKVQKVLRNSNKVITGYASAPDIVLSGQDKNIFFSGQPLLTDTRILDYYRPGRVFTYNNVEYEVVNVKLFASITGAQEVSANCEYRLGKSLIFEVANPASNTEVLQRTSCKNPIVSLYMSNDDVFTSGDLVKIFYLKKDPTAGTLQRGYRLRLKADGYPEYVIVGQYYKVAIDCGCDADDVYSCFGSDRATPLIFRYFTNNSIAVIDQGDALPSKDSAGVVFERQDSCYTSMFLQAINRKDCLTDINIDKYNFELLVNGTSIQQNIEDAALPIAINPGEPITSIEVRLINPDDPCNQHILTWNAPSEDVCECSSSNSALSFSALAANASVCTNGQIDFTIAGGEELATEYKVELYNGTSKLTTVTGATLVAINGTGTIVIPNNLLGKSRVYTVKVSQEIGDTVCSIERDVVVSCDCEVGAPTVSYDCGTNELTITFASGTVANANYTSLGIYQGSTFIRAITLDSGTNIQTVDLSGTPLPDGSYTFNVRYIGSGGSCDEFYKPSFIVNCLEGENFAISSEGCTGTPNYYLVRVNWDGSNHPYTISYFGEDGTTPIANTNGQVSFVEGSLNVHQIVFNLTTFADNYLRIQLEDTNKNVKEVITKPFDAVSRCDLDGYNPFTVSTSYQCTPATDLATLYINTSVDDSYSVTITPSPYAGTGTYTTNFTGTQLEINNAIQGITYDVLITQTGGNPATDTASISPSCAGAGPEITYTYNCNFGLALFEDGISIPDGTTVYINGAAVVYNAGLKLPANAPTEVTIIAVPGADPIFVTIPDCCSNIDFSYSITCSPLELEYSLSGGSNDYDVTFQGTTYSGLTDGTYTIGSPTEGTHILSIYDNVNECTKYVSITIDGCNASIGVVTINPTCFTIPGEDIPVNAGKIFGINVEGCDLGAITVSWGYPTSGGDETTISTWVPALAAGSNLWAVNFDAVFNTCYETFYFPGGLDPDNPQSGRPECATNPDGWHVPNGIYFKISIGAGSSCPARTLYSYVTPENHPMCTPCSGFFCYT